jgi:hypothetical protein
VLGEPSGHLSGLGVVLQLLDVSLEPCVVTV